MWTKLFNRSSTLGSTISSVPLKNLIFRKMVTPEVIDLNLHETVIVKKIYSSHITRSFSKSTLRLLYWSQMGNFPLTTLWFFRAKALWTNYSRTDRHTDMKTYFSFSALNCCVQSSNSFWFISMKSFRALYIKPCIVL